MGVIAEGQQQDRPAEEFAHAEECFREPAIQMSGVSGCAYFFEYRSAAEEHVAVMGDSCRATDGPDDANRDLGGTGG